MGVPFWVDDPESWNRIYVNDWLFDETKIEIEGDLGNDFDVKKAPGADGAPSTDKGYDPCKPQVKIVLYTEDHWTQYQGLLKDVQPRPGKVAPKVISVVHPRLQMHGKEKFKITKIHLLKDLGEGKEGAQLDLLEYFPSPKPIAAKKKTAEETSGSIRDANGTRTISHLLEENKPSKKPKP